MTKGVSTYQINSFWESGSLIFYEKQVGHTATGDVFTLGTEAVKIGGTSQDVDFQFYGSSSKSFIIDKGAATVTSAGLAWTITGSLAVTGAITLTGDVSLEGDLTLTTEDVSVAQGHMVYLDGQDGGEYVTSDTANYLLLHATTGVDVAIGATDEINITATAVTLPTNNLTLTAGEMSVAQGHYVYLDGQQGGEYIYSSGANELDLNATTETNLRIGGTTEIALTASALNINGVDVAVAAGQFITGAPVKQLITTKTGGQTLTAAESGVIRVTTDDVYIYLPTYLGNTGLTYTLKSCATHSAGIHVRANSTQLIDANNIQTSGAQYDAISIIATSANGWNVISKFGTWTGSTPP